MNHVPALIGRKFSLAEKVKLKELGPHRATIYMKQVYKGIQRYFNSEKWYRRKPWLCSCEKTNALFCYVCLVFWNGDKSAWVTSGFTDLKNLSRSLMRHESSMSHIDNATSYALLDKENILSKTDTSCRFSINTRNRYVLSKVIECIKLCREFDFEQTENSLNFGLFVGLIDLVADLDGSIKYHLQNETVLKDLLQSSVQEQLIDCMFQVCQCEILSEINAAQFLSIQVSEMTGSSTSPQVLMILRYEISGNLVERFWGIFNPSATTVDSFSKVILEQLGNILQTSSDKLISQSYDGSSLLQGREGSIPTIINEQYRRAHLVHSYAHQLNVIAQQATYSIPAVRIFFTSLSSFTNFFADAPKRIAVLNATLAQRHQAPPPFGWDFDSRAVNTVFLYAEELIAALESIQKGSNFDEETTRETTILLDLLKKPSFRYWLDQFNIIWPHVDILSSLMQTGEAKLDEIEREVSCMTNALAVNRETTLEDNVYDEVEDKAFNITKEEVEDEAVNKTEEETESGDGSGDGYLEEPTAPKLRRIERTRIPLIMRACNLISVQVKEQCGYIGHLNAVKLLFVDRFEEYSSFFPLEIFEITCTCYPCLDSSKLRYELQILYKRTEFRTTRSIMELLRFFVGNNLNDIYSELLNLLRIIVTTPMVTSEPDRCFTTIQRVKTFLRQTKCDQRLNALAMLMVEKKFMHDISEFNTKVIDEFAKIDVHRQDFMNP